MAMYSSSGRDSFTRSEADSEEDQKLLSSEKRDLSGTPPPASSAGPTDNQADADASPFGIRGLEVTGQPAHLEQGFSYIYLYIHIYIHTCTYIYIYIYIYI